MESGDPFALPSTTPRESSIAVALQKAESPETRRRLCKPTLVYAAKALNCAQTIRTAESEKRLTLEEHIDKKELESLMQCFFEEGKDGTEEKKMLDEEQFVAAVTEVMGREVDRADIHRWFARINAGASGKIGWDELSAFLLSHGQQREAADTRSSEYAASYVPLGCPNGNRHSDIITAIAVHPRTGRVFTGGRDGFIRTWEGDSLTHVKLVYQGTSWVTGLCMMRQGQRLVSCSVDRKLCVFDTKNCEVVRTYGGKEIVESEKGLRYANDNVETMDVGSVVASHAAPKNVRVAALNRLPPPNTKRAQLLDFDNFKEMMDVERSRRREKKVLELTALAGLMDSPLCVEHVPLVQAEDSVVLGTRHGYLMLYHLPQAQQRLVKATYLSQPHTDNVNKVCVSTSLDCLLSCSDDHTIKAVSLETFQPSKTFSRHGHERGVTHIDWSDDLKLIVSCGVERSVLVWNYLQDFPIFRLPDHSAPLHSAFISSADNQILSVSVDHVVRIYDVRTYRVLQTIHERITKDNTFSSYCYDTARKRLICAGSYPVQHVMKKKAATFPANYLGHTSPVVGSAYSHQVGRLLTLDNDTIIAWNVETGGCDFSFPLASYNPSVEELRLTSYAFDSLGRRLLTGFHNGTAVAWNFTNGQPLNVIKDVVNPNAEMHAVAAVLRQGATIYVCASGNCLITAAEGQQFTITDVGRWEVPEEYGPVQTIADTPGHVVACGTANGAVLFFHVRNDTLDGHALWVANFEDAKSPSLMIPRGHVGSRIERIVKLSTHPELLLSCHVDGRIAVWHAHYRAYVGSIVLSRCCPLVSNVAIDEQHNEYLAHSDDLGNVHVWALVIRECSPVVEHLVSNSSSPQPAATPSQRACSFDITDSHLLCRFHCHEQSIQSVTWVKTLLPCVATTAMDCLVKLFTIEGACVGVFGIKEWSLAKRNSWVSQTAAIVPHTNMSSEHEAFLQEAIVKESEKEKRRVSPATSETSPRATPNGAAEPKQSTTSIAPRPPQEEPPRQPATLSPRRGVNSRIAKSKSQRKLHIVKPNACSPKKRLLRAPSPSEDLSGSINITTGGGAYTGDPQIVLQHSESDERTTTPPGRITSPAALASTLGIPAILVGKLDMSARSAIANTPNAFSAFNASPLMPQPTPHFLSSRASRAFSGISALMEPTGEAEADRILTAHLKHSFDKLKHCRENVQEEVKRVSQRIAHTRQQTAALVPKLPLLPRPSTTSYQPPSQQASSARGPALGAHWTDRVSSFLELHKPKDGNFDSIRKNSHAETSRFRALSDRVTIFGNMRPPPAEGNRSAATGEHSSPKTART